MLNQVVDFRREEYIINHMVNNPHEALNVTFAALSDPTRRSILARLIEGDLSMNELAEPYEMSLAAVSKHIGVLKTAGLVSQEKIGRTRLCRINPKPLKDAAQWIEIYQHFWEEKLDALGEFLECTSSTAKENETWPQHSKPSPQRRSKSSAATTRQGKKSSKP